MPSDDRADAACVPTCDVGLALVEPPAEATVVEPSSVEGSVDVVDVPPEDGDEPVVLVSVPVEVFVVPVEVFVPVDVLPWLLVVSVPVDTGPTAVLPADVDVAEACVGSSLPPPPPPHALTSALTANAIVEPRTVSKNFKAMSVTEVGMSRSQSSSTANPEDTCCDTRSIGKAGEVSECKKQGNATAHPST